MSFLPLREPEHRVKSTTHIPASFLRASQDCDILVHIYGVSCLAWPWASLLSACLVSQCQHPVSHRCVRASEQTLHPLTSYCYMHGLQEICVEAVVLCRCPAKTPPGMAPVALAANSLSPSQLFKRYNHALKNSPIGTKSLTCMAAYGTGDVLAQVAFSKQKSPLRKLAGIDGSRTARMALYGLMWCGPAGHGFYSVLDKVRRCAPLTCTQLAWQTAIFATGEWLQVRRPRTHVNHLP